MLLDTEIRAPEIYSPLYCTSYTYLYVTYRPRDEFGPARSRGVKSPGFSPNQCE